MSMVEGLGAMPLIPSGSLLQRRSAVEPLKEEKKLLHDSIDRFTSNNWSDRQEMLQSAC